MKMTEEELGDEKVTKKELNQVHVRLNEIDSNVHTRLDKMDTTLSLITSLLNQAMSGGGLPSSQRRIGNGNIQFYSSPSASESSDNAEVTTPTVGQSRHTPDTKEKLKSELTNLNRYWFIPYLVETDDHDLLSLERFIEVADMYFKELQILRSETRL